MTPLRQEIRFTHLASGTRIAWARSGRSQPGTPTLVRAAHWMTHVEYDGVSPIFRPWLERLGRELRLVCHDERGCGLSASDDAALGLDASVEELQVVVDAVAEPRVALLGIGDARVAQGDILGGAIAYQDAMRAGASDSIIAMAEARLARLGAPSPPADSQ